LNETVVENAEHSLQIDILKEEDWKYNYLQKTTSKTASNKGITK